MFTPVEIEGAFQRLFGMYNQEKVRLLRSAFKEEIASISPEILAGKYSKCAVQPQEFREMQSTGKPGDWQGLPLLDQKAAFVTENLGNAFTCEKFHVIQSTELWLLEDMTFVTILCTEFYDVENDVYQNGIECRAFLAVVEDSSAIPINEETLIYTLEDTCIFARAEQKAEAIDEEQ